MNTRSLKMLAALAVLVSAVLHLYLWFDGYRDVDTIGPLFLLNAFGGIVIVGLILGWNHWIPAFLALGFGASTLGGFVLSTTVGLFGLEESWTGWAVWVAAASEVAAIVLGGLLLRVASSGRQLQDHPAVERPHLH
jgi:hypothetical protein